MPFPTWVSPIHLSSLGLSISDTTLTKETHNPRTCTQNTSNVNEQASIFFSLTNISCRNVCQWELLKLTSGHGIYSSWRKSRSVKETQRNSSIKLRREKLKEDKPLSDAQESKNIRLMEIMKTIQHIKIEINKVIETLKRNPVKWRWD